MTFEAGSIGMSCNGWSPEKDNMFDEPYEEPPLDEGVLTPEQKVELDKLCKENPTLTRRDLAIMIRMNIMTRRATFEGRLPTSLEDTIAWDLEEVIYWVPPCQLKGTIDSTFEIIDYEVSHLPCIEDVASSLHTPKIIDECYDLICETQKLDTLRVEKIAKEYHEVCFNVNYLCALKDDLEFKLSMSEESRSLPEKSHLEDVLDVDRILNEIENPKVEMNSRKEHVVFYMIDGDEVDYFVIDSFKPKIDFIFPPHAFDPHKHITIMTTSKICALFVLEFLDLKYESMPWIVAFHVAQLVSHLDRRRTKGALAQPFDTYD